MADDEALTETIWYIDAFGFKQELRVSKATARGINAIRARYRRAAQRFREHHVDFEDLASRRTGRQPDPSEGESYARTRLRKDGPDTWWEGPRFAYLQYIGEGRIWPIAERADGRCPACLDQRLDYQQYCLHCDQSGRDLAIGKPTPADLRKRQLAKLRDPDGLAGGREKAKAKKPPTAKQEAAKRDKAARQAKARRKAAREAKYAARRARPKF